MPADSDILARGIASLGLPDPGRLESLMVRYIGELEKWNPRYGLVNASGDELVVKHVLDSLSAWRVIEARGRQAAVPAAAPSVLDVGSGAGFPGVPLAAALPGFHFTLLERSSKRAVFLQNCAVLLGLANARVVEADLAAAARAPEIARSAPFAVVTFRAVAPLVRFLSDLDRSGLPWRSVVAYKGKASRVEEELKEIGREWMSRARVETVSVPFLDEERCLVVIRA
jgi:16S rRNA (guanine527-N7)-methyltransferase